MHQTGAVRHVRILAQQDAADGQILVLVDFDIHAAQRVDHRLHVFKVDQNRALDLNIQFALQTGDDAAEPVVFIEQVDLRLVAARVVDLAVAQDRGEDDAVVFRVQRHEDDGIRSRVVRDMLRVTVLAEHQIVLDLRIGFAQRRRADEREHQQGEQTDPFFHTVLQMWGKSSQNKNEPGEAFLPKTHLLISYYIANFPLRQWARHARGRMFIH